MAVTWTSPHTYVTGELLTKSFMDTQWRDNLLWLKTPTESGNITFAADITTSSTSYTDVTGVTTTITTFGGGVDVFWRCTLLSTLASSVVFQLVIDGVSEEILGTAAVSTTTNIESCFFHHVAALSATSHIIKIQVKTSAGTLTIRGTTSGVGDPLFYVREAGA